MQLTIWTYEGPPHVGAMRIATAMNGVHYVLHAPQGDTYADLLFTMIERRKERPPVTYTTFQARDLGSDTADLVKRAARGAAERFKPDALLVGASCTAELIQDDPQGISKTLGLDVPVVPLELPSYSKKENWGAAETFYRIVRTFVSPDTRRTKADRPSCNLLGPTALGFRHRDDVVEIQRLLSRLGIDVHVVAPLNARPADIARLPLADFNVVLYPEIAETAARFLTKTFDQPATTTIPIGVGATRDWVREVAQMAGVDPEPVLAEEDSRLPWYSRSIDSTYLTGKRVFIFGDATHALAAARVAREELGFEVVGLGTYSREFARNVRSAAKEYGVDPLITDDHLAVEERVVELQPELVLGTQMERHVAKRLGIPCAVISAPVHVQDYPARYSPQMGFEGANVLFDTWVHPLMMGLEEHLLHMFRDDFEFSDAAGPSHLNHSPAAEPADAAKPPPPPTGSKLSWTPEAEKELKKIPFFVRGKGASQHRAIRDRDRRFNNHLGDPLRCQSALQPLTTLVADTVPGAGSGGFYSAIAHDGEIYYRGIDTAAGAELWRTDGTAGGTTLVADVNVGAGWGYSGVGIGIGSEFFFAATDGLNGTELWKTDGTPGGTVLVKEIRPGFSSGNPSSFVEFGGLAYFIANDGISGAELWKSDGTELGTELAVEIRPGSYGAASIYTTKLVEVGGQLILMADDGTTGVELWKSDGTVAGTAIVADIFPGTDWALDPTAPLFVQGDRVYFKAKDGLTGREAWSSDGTFAGTYSLGDVSPGESDAFPGFGIPTEFVQAGGLVYFGATTAAEGHELYAYSVPEPGFALALAIGCAVLAARPGRRAHGEG